MAISIAATMLGEKVQTRFLRLSSVIRLSILFRGEENVLPFVDAVQKLGCRIEGLDMAKPINPLRIREMLLHLPHRTNHRDMIEKLRSLPGVVFAEDI